MLDVIDLTMDKNIVDEVKSFLDEVCKTVLKRNEIMQQKIALQSLGDRAFYTHFIDSLQIKFFIFKMNEHKMKQVEEVNYLKFQENERKLYNEAKKTTSEFLTTSIKQTVNAYKKYTAKVLPIVVKLQSTFRGHLTRLISKMELMNYKLTQEQEKAVVRARAKTIGKTK
jgi:hypothetical protein